MGQSHVRLSRPSSTSRLAALRVCQRILPEQPHIRNTINTETTTTIILFQPHTSSTPAGCAYRTFDLEHCASALFLKLVCQAQWRTTPLQALAVSSREAPFRYLAADFIAVHSNSFTPPARLDEDFVSVYLAQSNYGASPENAFRGVPDSLENLDFDDFDAAHPAQPDTLWAHQWSGMLVVTLNDVLSG